MEKKIGIAVAVWGRYELGQRVLKHTKRLCKEVEKENPGIKFEIWACGDQVEWGLLLDLLQINKTYFPNENLGKKFNHLFEKISQKTDWFLHLGSDDFIKKEFLTKALKIIENSKETDGAIGIKNMLVHDNETKKSVNVKYANNRTIGSRFYNSKIVQKIFEKRGKFWPEENRGLDGCAIPLLKQFGGMEITIPTDGPLLCSVKTVDNLWKFSEYEGRYPEVKADLSEFGI